MRSKMEGFVCDCLCMRVHTYMCIYVYACICLHTLHSTCLLDGKTSIKLCYTYVRMYLIMKYYCSATVKNIYVCIMFICNYVYKNNMYVPHDLCLY